jgi:RNA polymerase primary sigma factor
MAHPGQTNSTGEVLELLLVKVEAQGFLTQEDINEIVNQLDDDQLLHLMRILCHYGVEIINDNTGREQDGDIGDQDDFPLDQNNPSFNLDSISIEDSVGLYLKEMSQVPLLSLEEEISLARQIEQGKESAQILTKNDDQVSASDCQKLEDRIQNGLSAREHLITANTRLVVSIAKKYIGRGVPFIDLIQEGNLGLMKAVEKFEYRRGFRFSTYATWWIRQTITRAVADQSRTIRVPVHMSDKIRHMYRLSQELEQRFGRPPTCEELADEMGLEHRKVQWMIRVSWSPISLESPVGDEEDSELGTFIEDINTPTPHQVVTETMLHDVLERVLATLSAREARILRMRFGLDGNPPFTLEEVGQKFGLTRERIRQIERKALRRLRQPRRAKLLRDYL